MKKRKSGVIMERMYNCKIICLCKKCQRIIKKCAECKLSVEKTSIWLSDNSEEFWNGYMGIYIKRVETYINN